MPFESSQQRKAMFAAAKGKSTIGIPESVAQKFVADEGSGPSTEGGKLPKYTSMARRDIKRKALAGTKPPSPGRTR